MLQTVTRHNLKYRKYSRISGILMSIAYLVVIMIAFPLTGNAQDQSEYDEISVFLNIQKVGGIDIPAVIRDEKVYLPVVDIFSFLKIKNNPSAQLDSVTGFFISQQATYSIDKTKNRITFQGKVYDLKSDDMIKTETNLYLRSPFFGQIFGLDCIFSFRSLSVILSTKLELPVIREMRQEQMRANISKLKGEVKTDTIIGRKYPAFHFGMADWSVQSTQQLQGRTDTRLNLALGTVIAGGEANALLNYSNNTPFSEKQQQYLWRFVNNDRPMLRQVMAGKIYSQVTSSIYNPIVGVQFTNTPTTYRRSFGTYTLSDITEPNWTVELYVNNVLVDYLVADASGFYKFEVPLVYGNSAVKLKFYGPWGEERIKEENISIPFNFLPAKELEYSVSAGIVEDTLSSRFSRATVNYGVSRRLTVGGGVEYLSSVITGNTMPFVSASLRLMSGLLFTTEYTYGVRTKGLLSYRLPSNLQFELNYTKYDKGQKAIIYNYLEERKAVVSIPIKGKNFAAYSRLTVNQIVLPNLKNTNAEMLWSGSVYGVSTNFTTYGLFTDLTTPYVYSNLSLAFRLPSRITITPQVQYEYNNSQLISARTNLEKPLFKHGYLNMSYEQNFRSNTRSIEVGFRYDLSFAQTGFSVRNTNDQTTLVESARGSLLYDRKTRYLGTNNRTSVGKGAITLLPFLDVNGNGHRDKGEPKAANLQFRINGGTIVRNEKDTTIRILDLTPYTSYLLELDKNSFDNISWQMHNLTMKVMIDPNQFKTIEVPISVMGEGSGTVYNGERGQGRMLVCFYRSDSTLAARTLTESDGYYSYLGLKPGKYTVRIDPEQLKKLKMVASPELIPITITHSFDGDIVESLDFKLSLSKEQVPDTTNIVPPVGNAKQEPANYEPVKGTKPGNKPSETLTKGSSIVGYEGDVLQIGAFKTKANAFEALKKLEKITGKPANMVYEEGYYKVRIPGFANRSFAKQFSPELNKLGFSYTYIPVLKAQPSYQVGEYAKEIDAINAQKEWISRTTKPVLIIFDKGLYKVRIPGIIRKEEGDSLFSKPGKVIKQQHNPGNMNDTINRANSSANQQYTSAIQVGAFADQKNAIRAKKKIIKITELPVVIVFEGGLYQVRIIGFTGRVQALEIQPRLRALGFTEAYVIRVKQTQINQ
jgi:cell division protein FtsN